MLLARMLDGASGGNILVAQAYVADVTTPENRARGMGLIGMAFGLGFVLGPLLGGLILSLPLAEDLRLRLPFLVAAGFSTIAWVLVLTRLPEPPREGAVRKEARVVNWRGIVDTLTLPRVGLLVLTGFLSVLGFATFEGTFSLYLKGQFHWDESSASFAFAGLGFLSALVQGGLIRRLVPRFGEARLIVSGLVLASAGFAGLAIATNIPELAIAMFLLGLGQGMLSPSVSGLLSRLTPESEQGAVFGTLSSAQTLARIISYGAANVLLGQVSFRAPYWCAFVVDLLALAVAVNLVLSFGRRNLTVESPIRAPSADLASSGE